MTAFLWGPLWVGMAAVTPTVALAGGVLLAFRYRHKANVSVESTAVRTAHGIILEARSTVGAVGPFRLKILRASDGAQVTVTAVVATSDSTADADL